MTGVQTCALPISTGRNAEIDFETEHPTLIQAVAKANGVKLGRPKRVGDGQDKRIKVTTEQESIVIQLKNEGESVSGIARATNLSRPTIYSILSQSEDQAG